MSPRSGERQRFLTDRMLGTLTRYLRFMGYDTMSANSLSPGSSREDTLLLEIAGRDDRLLLTRDRELARRGGEQAVYIASEEIIAQIRQIADLGLIEPEIR
ncbi:MAG: Mut7-C RNAse domain-containing protein, partial [Methanoculleus horonobensis]|nr:Mut7-C RNAse domain-containing protein [Methanoculleus horonobensis]